MASGPTPSRGSGSAFSVSSYLAVLRFGRTVVWSMDVDAFRTGQGSSPAIAVGTPPHRNCQAKTNGTAPAVPLVSRNHGGSPTLGVDPSVPETNYWEFLATAGNYLRITEQRHELAPKKLSGQKEIPRQWANNTRHGGSWP